MAIPQARLLGSLYRGGAGTWPFAGGIQAALRISDWQSGHILAAAVDNRVGGGHLKTAGVWEWGDAENVMTEWAAHLSTKLHGYTSGKERP
jgi:hypothetical protein